MERRESKANRDWQRVKVSEMKWNMGRRSKDCLLWNQNLVGPFDLAVSMRDSRDSSSSLD